MIFSINRQHFQMKFDHLLPNEFDHLVHAHGIFCHLKHNTFFQKWLFHAIFFVVLWKVESKNWYVSFRALFIFLGCFYKYLQNYNFLDHPKILYRITPTGNPHSRCSSTFVFLYCFGGKLSKRYLNQRWDCVIYILAFLFVSNSPSSPTNSKRSSYLKIITIVSSRFPSKWEFYSIL